MLLVLILVLLLCGGGFGGYRAGYWGPGGTYNPIGLILLVLLLVLIFGGLGSGFGWHRYGW